MDKRLYDQTKQHGVDPIAAALDALGQDVNAAIAGRTVYDQAGLAIKSGGLSPQFSITSKVRFGINGALYVLNQQSALSFSAAVPVIPVSSSCAFLVQVNTLAQVSTKAGAVAAGANPSPPAPDLGNAALGIIWVQTNGSVTFTPGTTVLDLPGLTVEYISFMSISSGLGAYPRLPTKPYTSASALDGAPGPQPDPFNPQNY